MYKNLRRAFFLVSCYFCAVVYCRPSVTHYTFGADRHACDGQCYWCRDANVHARWGRVREVLATYNDDYYARKKMDVAKMPRDGKSMQELHIELQNMMDWTWEMLQFECVPGVIAMRLSSYAYTDIAEFMEPNSLDFLLGLNSNTGVLDLLQSSWPGILAGQWPIFAMLNEVGRKVNAHLADEPESYPDFSRKNFCDELDADSTFVQEYVDELNYQLDHDQTLEVGHHLGLVLRRTNCEVGLAMGLLGTALHLVDEQHIYQSSLEEIHNIIFVLVTAAQDALIQFTQQRNDISLWFDLLTTRWPLWRLLARLSCTTSGRSCVTRSPLECFDPKTRQFVDCKDTYQVPQKKVDYTMCGEHDWCTVSNSTNSLTYQYYETTTCVDWKSEQQSKAKTPWVRTLSHDSEARVCSQCGQDGILKAIFENIGFAQANKPPFFVEFGARKPHQLNSSWLRIHCGWKGLLMDFQPGLTQHGGCGNNCVDLDEVANEFITAENVNEIFQKHGVPSDFDLLTVDVDFNDYWIWRSILEKDIFHPRVVALDYNADLPLDQAKAVHYKNDAEWDGTKYTTASLLAYYIMAQEFNYEYVYNLEMGSHVFFVRRDLLHEADHGLPLRAVRKNSHMKDTKNRNFVDTLYGSDATGLLKMLGLDKKLKEKEILSGIMSEDDHFDL